MIRLNEDALICDFAETYHIYNYRALPAQLAATLAAGLGDNSRIMMLLNNQPEKSEILLLSGILDSLHAIIYGLSDGSSDRPQSIVSMLFNGEEKPVKSCMSFDSAEEFEAYRENLVKEGIEEWQQT